MDLIPLEFQTYEQWLGWLIGVVTSLVVQGEGQAFFVLMFQPLSQREKVAYDLNPLHHIDPRALPVLLLAGWGWGKKRVEPPPYFPPSWQFRSLIPLAAPVASMCLVGFFGTIYLFLPSAIVQTAIEISVLFAVANILIPIPPMALGRALCCTFPVLERRQPTLEMAGIVCLTIIVAVEYWTKTSLLQAIIVPITKSITKWVLWS